MKHRHTNDSSQASSSRPRAAGCSRRRGIPVAARRTGLAAYVRDLVRRFGMVLGCRENAGRDGLPGSSTPYGFLPGGCGVAGQSSAHDAPIIDQWIIARELSCRVS